MAKWSLDLDKYSNDKLSQIKEIRRAFVFRLYSSIAKKTPVDTGRARGNWDISVGADDTSSVSDETTIKFSKMSQVPETSKDEAYYIFNNLPYITKLEYGGYPNPPKKDGGKTVNGYSKRAPEGMVGLALANAKNLFNSAVRSVTKK